MLDLDKLQHLIETDPQLVTAALDVVERGDSVKMTLEAIVEASKQTSPPAHILPAQILYDFLKSEEKLGPFINQARLRFRQIVKLPDPNIEFKDADPEQFGFQIDQMQKFLSEASRWRCRIYRGDDFVGTGFLVSPRLVMSAYHVCAAEDGDCGNLHVRPTADHVRYSAICVYKSDCHPGELADNDVPPEQLANYNDVILLRLSSPLGFYYDRCPIPQKAPCWTEDAAFVLLHFPQNVDHGPMFGRITYSDRRHARFVHDLPTDPGSSGGPAFTNKFELIGLHQGRLSNSQRDLRRVVPLAYSLEDDLFVETLKNDREPVYLWSLNASVDGHLVIGRDAFFEALNEIADEQRPALRGIHVVGDEGVTEVSGVRFSHELLAAYLEARGSGGKLVRVPLDKSISDLFDHVARLLELPDTVIEPLPGVQPGQATPVASELDRSKGLIARIEALARPIWLHFEQPGSDLPGKIRGQLEQLIPAMLQSRTIYLLLTGFETANGMRTYSSIDQIGERDLPGLMIDRVARFRQKDVVETIKRIAKAHNEPATDQIAEHTTAKLINTLLVDKKIKPAISDSFSSSDLPQIVESLRNEMKTWPKISEIVNAGH